MDRPAECSQPCNPKDRNTDEFWQDAWNFDTEAMRELLSLTQKASICQSFRSDQSGGEAIYEFHFEGSIRSGGGAYGFVVALMKEIERLKPREPDDAMGAAG